MSTLLLGQNNATDQCIGKRKQMEARADELDERFTSTCMCAQHRHPTATSALDRGAEKA